MSGTQYLWKAAWQIVVLWYKFTFHEPGSLIPLRWAWRRVGGVYFEWKAVGVLFSIFSLIYFSFDKGFASLVMTIRRTTGVPRLQLQLHPLYLYNYNEKDSHWATPNYDFEREINLFVSGYYIFISMRWMWDSYLLHVV
jgi:hypothetical protein